MRVHHVALTLLAAFLCACGEGGSDRVVPRPDAGTAPAVPKKKVAGQLEAPVGTVTLERGAEKRPAKVEPLYAGDFIDTGADSTATLRFGGDRVVELGPDGRFEVGSDGASVSLNVLEGLVLTRVKATPSQEEGDVLVTINTPFGLTRVGSAELSLKVKDGAADVDVKFGEIELVNKAGEVTKVGAGKKGFLGTVRELPEIPLTIVINAGVKAELKAKDSKSFVAINPKKPPALKSGDTVRVKEGRFSLAPEGSSTRVVLLKGTSAGIVEARKGAGGDATALDVQKGELEVVAPGGQSTRLGIARGVTLVSDLGGQFTVKRTGSGFDVEALAGDVLIERDGEEPQTVPGGQSATVPLKGKPTVRAANREPIALPARNVRLFHTGLKKVSFQWDDDDGATKAWRFQLATDPAFKTVVRDGVVHEAFTTAPVEGKAWYWRVFKGTAEHARGSVSFAPEPKATDLARNTNEVRSGVETSIHFQDKDKPPQVTFRWDPEEGAAKYLVRVYRAGQLGSTVAERTVPEALVSLPENTLAEGDYLWSVTSLDAKGTEVKGGPMTKLHMTFDNGVASLLIKSPRNGDAGGKAVKTSGVVPPGARLFINARAVELDEHGRFDTSVAPLAGGRIVYRLVSGGAEAWTVRTVKGK